MEDVRLDGEHLRDIFEGGIDNGTLLRRVRLHNPHSLAVRVAIESPERFFVDLGAATWMWGTNDAEMVARRVDHRGVAIPFGEDVACAVDFEVACTWFSEYPWGVVSNFIVGLDGRW